VPSEYFRRQIYGCFWFEEQVALDAIRKYPDNILFESDYPHPTCQHPGPRTAARRPRDYAQDLFASVPDDVVTKVLHDNAASVYKLS
jgi:predicted TIM-barrel fold metal-dependent hydrolase